MSPTTPAPNGHTTADWSAPPAAPQLGVTAPPRPTSDTAPVPTIGGVLAATVRQRRRAKPRSNRTVAAAAVAVPAVFAAWWLIGDRIDQAVDRRLVAAVEQGVLPAVGDRIDEAVAAARGEIGPTVVAAAPLSWAACPLTSDAKALITMDPATGFSTLHPQRGAKVDREVQQLLAAGATLGQVRVHAPAADQLLATTDPAKGVPLFACAPGAGGQ